MRSIAPMALRQVLNRNLSRFARSIPGSKRMGRKLD
jgi:hypothetical protein